MRKLLIGVIRFSGNLLSKLAAVHQIAAVQHIDIACEAEAKLLEQANALVIRAKKLEDEAGNVLIEGREAARASREEAAQCAAIADIVKSIK